MPSWRHQQLQPQLQVPVQPTFPLSSPISEEISSPSCSSAEDRDLERTRPFDFLVKATKHKIETKSGKDGNRSPKLSQRDRHDHHKRHSIRGITKKKKNVAKPVGLNLVTDFSLAAPPKKQPDNGSAPFVDLNDLKLLSEDRAKERSGQKKDSTSINGDLSEITNPSNTSNSSRKRASFHQLPEETSRIQIQSETGNPFLDPKLENPFNDRFDHGLSPSDRHVMIGLSVPRNESSYHTREIDSAGTPLTPSIIVTPAREDAPWSTSSPEGLRPRATSSIYSQPTPRLWQSDPDIPPVPAIPAEHSTKKAAADSDFLSAHFAAMTRKHRSMSVETIIEDDVADRGLVQETQDDNDRAPLTRLSVNTQAMRPESQGWWTYLLSPLLGKKSPLSPSFPRSAAASAPSTKDTNKEWWEKEVSCFSPETPESAVPSQWQESKKGLEQSRSLGVSEEPDSSAKRQTAASMIFGGRSIQGEAAEYYQACAHEMFSQTSYFECHNHICSITPAAVVAAIYAAQFESDKGETRDRGLIFAEAQAQEKNRSLPQTGGNRGLLIDVDSPTQGMKEIEHSKEIGSPASATSSDSWSSSITDENEFEHEKGLTGPPQAATRGLVPDAPSEQPIHPPPAAAPFHEPAPAPTAFMPEPPPPGPIPIAPAVMPEPPPPVQAPPPQFINTISPPTNNIHYMQQPVAMPPEPAPVDRVAPSYGPVVPSVNEPTPAAPMPQEQPRGMSEWPIVPPPAAQNPTHEGSTRAAPIPLPMRGQSNPELQQDNHVLPPNPAQNEPISPAFQRAAGGPGAIQMNSMNEVHAPAPAYTQYPRDEAPLPPRYALHPAPGAAIMNPTRERGPAEARRQRLEREDAIGRKVGGFWRGRGCFSKKGCFGRPGREGRTKRRWYFCICLFFLVIVILAIVLAITLTRKGDTTPVQSQWLNLTGYPPMPTGISTVAGAEPQVEQSGCIKPSSLWSCALPNGQQSDNKPYAADEPNFRLEIRFRNGTYDNSTVASTTSKTRRADANSWDPSPSPPSTADQTFIGNTTDGNSLPYAGEETPFYITILSPVQITSSSLYRRSSTNDTTTFPNLTAVIPAPSENSDGTAAAATLYPLPKSQPIRLYNRGKDNEHYGFYTYFDKSIFLASRAPLNGSATDYSPLDTNGGSTESDAVVRCTWSQTRFLVQIWTQPSKLGYTLLKSGSNNSTSTTSTSAATPTSTSEPTSSSSATDFTRPGSFPYPISITVDRHGGAEKKKLLYCYGVESDQHYNITDRKLQLEDRGFGGSLVNPASGIFDDLGGDSSSNSSAVYGGVDGGTGGCSCRWANWITRS
ncbi:uncharacterized protein N7458_003908 [Penicillium daleae]|uniref:Uncharacterized protein n=1 Tax=Penicillium daleae TaxID=63821 RepID=A0AAD6C9Z4_9EURO|nr:uncharacterized protein N7458_003908 [Penicillium daleae]KAJ5455644.1 hypothetical protein N7458_003908 [Penicillium daleae]